MPVSKTETTNDSAEAPRRSGRISARTGDAPAPAAASAPVKKRAADDATKKEAKKPKADEEEAKPVSSAGGQLKVGDALPSLTLKDENGADLDVGAIKKAVIFSYPKANTSGCTKQGQCYRDAYSDWQATGYAVYGLSNDGPTSLKNWKDKQNFPYTLISDPKRELVGPLTGSKDKTKRSHFVVDEEGKLSLISLSVKPPESSSDALKFVKSKM